MSNQAALVWVRRDLRLADNRALEAASQSGAPILPVFIWAPEDEAPWAPGSASGWWLHQSLQKLGESLRKRGSNLLIRRGPANEVLPSLAAESGAKAVYWNRVYEPWALALDRELESVLRKGGLAVTSFRGNVLFEPGTIRNRSGEPFRVFTSFWKACLHAGVPDTPGEASARIRAPEKWPASLPLENLSLEPKVDWAAGLRQAWRPGELGAAQQMKTFVKQPLERYFSERDRPDHSGTSRLSPHLHFGELSVRQVWHEVQRHLTGERHNEHRLKAEAYIRQLVWREFAHHLLFHYPETPTQPLRPEFRFFPWRLDEKNLRAWTRGRTGYPLVDAGMRELWRTGWMHNRVRMVAASFLVKHLLIPWQEGTAWFWDTLVDADLANNTLGWQWIAGCGADAAPYFRIFNPEIQGERFDPEGDYVRTWVPELARLPTAWIHKPWKAPRSELQNAGILLGSTYPLPIVEHTRARERALAALATMKNVSDSVEYQGPAIQR